jgi:hypothetical protein
MTKNERKKLVDLLTHALTVNETTSFSYTHPTGAFNRGYEWGLQVAMETVGFTKCEIWDIWNDTREKILAERNRA